MKRFRMFAGPNGSGKSTLVKEIDKDLLGFYVNADDIERKLNDTKFIDCNNYLPILVNQTDWEKFKPIIAAEDTRATPQIIDSIKITEGILTTESTINSYTAAVIAEFLRFILLECDNTFSFETVMSHQSKVSFIKKAKTKGFKTYLYFISTSDPSINVDRVRIRKNKGGHDVDENKIVNRYYNSIELLSEAFLNVDRAYVFDNSTDNHFQNVLIEKNGNHVQIYSDEIPEWIEIYLLDKIGRE